MSLALISVHSLESELLHNTMSLMNHPVNCVEKLFFFSDPLRENLIYFLLCTVSKEALLGLFNPCNHTGVSCRKRIPCCVGKMEADICN